MDDGMEIDGVVAIASYVEDDAASTAHGSDGCDRAVDTSGHGRGPDSSGRGDAANKKPAKKDQTTKIKCRGCFKWNPLEDMAINSPFCRGCKQMMDNLTHMAKQQNVAEWWREVRSDEQKLKQVLASYRDKCPQSKEKGKRGTINLVQYKEKFEAEASSAVTSRGRMMWSGHYLSFAQTPKGGGYSEREAKARWQQMKDDPDTIKDEKGPAHAPTRPCQFDCHRDVALLFTVLMLCMRAAASECCHQTPASQTHISIIIGHCFTLSIVI
jgi:hypothetical protein